MTELIPQNGVNWHTGKNWDGNLVNSHLCDGSLRDTDLNWDRNLVNRHPCHCSLILM